MLDYAQTIGITTEEYAPYNPNAGCNPQEGYREHLTKIANYEEITEKEIEACLINDGSVLAGMRVYADFSFYKSGIYSPVTKVFSGNHAILIIGYGETEQEHRLGCLKMNSTVKYWICKNSWGIGWGEKGFFKIKRGVCGIGKIGLFNIKLKEKEDKTIEE